jgi:hypothetical protein
MMSRARQRAAVASSCARIDMGPICSTNDSAYMALNDAILVCDTLLADSSERVFVSDRDNVLIGKSCVRIKSPMSRIKPISIPCFSGVVETGSFVQVSGVTARGKVARVENAKRLVERRAGEEKGDSCANIITSLNSEIHSRQSSPRPTFFFGTNDNVGPESDNLLLSQRWDDTIRLSHCSSPSQNSVVRAANVNQHVRRSLNLPLHILACQEGVTSGLR